MMEFLKHLKEDALSRRLIEEKYSMNLDFPYRTRFFEGIKFNNEIMLSIQASGIHHSKPEKTLSDLSQYEAFELGIKCLKVENYVAVDFATVDKSFSKIMRDYFDGSIYNNVPRDLVEEIFQKLKTEHGLFGQVLSDQILADPVMAEQILTEQVLPEQPNSLEGLTI